MAQQLNFEDYKAYYDWAYIHFTGLDEHVAIEHIEMSGDAPDRDEWLDDTVPEFLYDLSNTLRGLNDE
jgi:hypothetical protein